VGKKGCDRAFRSLKNESMLTTYFCKMKELVAYYYRVVYQPDGHFSPPAPMQDKSGPVPQARPVVRSTARQRQAMEEIINQLRQQDKQS
jgi:hypothetical protein